MKSFTRLFVAGAFSALLFCGSAQALSLTYYAKLSGAAEAPPNASPGTGKARVVYDPVAHTLSLDAVFSGLIGTVTAAHIHGPTALPGTGTAGVITQTPTFVGFPSGVTFGSYQNTFDLTLASSWNASFVANQGGGSLAVAESVFATALADGKTYLNIHSTVFGGGEIRGFLRVPDGSTSGALLLIGLGSLLPLVRRFRKAS